MWQPPHVARQRDLQASPNEHRVAPAGCARKIDIRCSQPTTCSGMSPPGRHSTTDDSHVCLTETLPMECSAFEHTCSASRFARVQKLGLQHDRPAAVAPGGQPPQLQDRARNERLRHSGSLAALDAQKLLCLGSCTCPARHLVDGGTIVHPATHAPLQASLEPLEEPLGNRV